MLKVWRFSKIEQVYVTLLFILTKKYIAPWILNSMNSITKIALLFFVSINFMACDFFKQPAKIPTVPILYFNFNGNHGSSGIEPFNVYGNQKMSYSLGLKDSCLDLSIHSHYRKPIVVETKNNFIPPQQTSFSVMVWVKMQKDDLQEYGILGNKGINDNIEKGWMISSTAKGTWQFEISDGFNHKKYKPTAVRQRINDDKWHLLGFMVDKNQQVARTFFDGKLVGVISLNGINGFDADYNLYIGCNPASRDYTVDTFNGMIDEVGVWSQKLSDEHFKNAYLAIKKERMAPVEKASETINVMTWNIWNGGKQQGKTVGLDKIATCIQENNADIISLQEEFGSGEYLADKLNFYFYKRSHNLSLLSRFPLGKSFNIYKPVNSGGVEVLLNKDKKIIVCPVWLSFKPNIKGLLMNSDIKNDTILYIEESTRGNEINFILSELNHISNNLNTSSIVLSGDFNSGSHLDWTEENKKNKYNKVIKFPAASKMKLKGFKDAYREIWPNETESLGNTYSPIFKEDFMDRIDFIYYKGKNLEAINAYVIDSTANIFPSDHAAVMVTFKLNH